MGYVKAKKSEEQKHTLPVKILLLNIEEAKRKQNTKNQIHNMNTIYQKTH